MKSPLFLAALAPLLWTPAALAQSAPPPDASSAAPPPPAPPPAPAPSSSPASAPMGAPPPPTLPTLTLTPPPVGEAAPATAAATTPSLSPIRAGLEIFAQYAYRVTNSENGSSSWYHSFDVPRAHGAIAGDYGPLSGRLLVEAVRSSSEGALIGVSGDSLVLRVREAYAAYHIANLVDVSAGVIPTLTIPELDGTWMMRAVTASPLETSGNWFAGDIGAAARLKIPGHYGWVAVAAYNGEGYAQEELNRGKNIEVAAEIHPLPSGALLPFAVFGSYTNGSTGTELARADRATAALLYQGERLRAGVDYDYAWGVGTNGAQTSSIVDAFVRVEPVERLLVGGRISYWDRNAGTSAADTETTLTGTVGWRFGDPLEAFLAATRALSSTEAQSEDPGSNYWELRVVSRVVF